CERSGTPEKTKNEAKRTGFSGRAVPTERRGLPLSRQPRSVGVLRRSSGRGRGWLRLARAHRNGRGFRVGLLVGEPLTDFLGDGFLQLAAVDGCGCRNRPRMSVRAVGLNNEGKALEDKTRKLALVEVGNNFPF